ncbi:MAG: hypothetical protein AMJ94_14230 [Deltaproteobacteria bacterium SM23_61]|nr:MAG: hypothetical protein AMJ94_14230 [Deltaproteobacteria bacterium SM23_61]
MTSVPPVLPPDIFPLNFQPPSFNIEEGCSGEPGKPRTESSCFAGFEDRHAGEQGLRSVKPSA